MKLWITLVIVVVFALAGSCFVGIAATATRDGPLTIDEIAKAALAEIYETTDDKYYYIIELQEQGKSNTVTYLMTVYYENINSRTAYEEKWCIEVLDKKIILDYDLLNKEAYEYGRRIQSN